MNIKIISNVLIIILFNILLIFLGIQDYLIFSLFSYCDEIIALFGIIILLINFISLKSEKRNILFLIFSIIFIIFLYLYSILIGLQSIYYITIDLLANIKFFISIYLFYYIFRQINFDYVKRFLCMESKIITILFFILTIGFYLFNIFPSIEFRYGVKCLRLFFPNYTVFAATLTFILLIIYVFDKSRLKQFFMILLSIMIILTFRSKAIGFCVFFWGYLIFNNTRNRVFKILIIIPSIYLFLYFALNQFFFYFIEIQDSARNLLLKTSFIIAKDYFPLGSGFGSFGSSASAVNYSPIYEIYGLDKVFGLQPNNPVYISDSFWPMIIGQFGIVGLMFYVYLIIFIIKKIAIIGDSHIRNAAILAIVYLLLSSFSESSFVHPYSLQFAFILGLSFAYNFEFKKIILNKEVII